jgi:hypothetical protein
VKSPLRAAAGWLALTWLAGAAAAAVAQTPLRAYVRVDRESVAVPGPEYPLSDESVRRLALLEAAGQFAGMIYGWDFAYDVGDGARGIAEAFEAAPRGAVAFGDPRLAVVSAEADGGRLLVWMEYTPDAAQARRLETWSAADARIAQAEGYAPLADGDGAKDAALRDAARAALRALLRAREQNRPKEARGSYALAAAPRYWVDAGRWAVSARFRFVLDEIVPFTVY